MERPIPETEEQLEITKSRQKYAGLENVPSLEHTYFTSTLGLTFPMLALSVLLWLDNTLLPQQYTQYW